MQVAPKKKLPPSLYSWPALLVFIVLIVLLGIGVVKLIPKQAHTNNQKKIAQERFQELREQEVVLQHNISTLETERGIEARIREDFRMAKEGEEIIVIVEEQPTDEDAAGAGSGFWDFLKRLFSSER